ncbi:hypothetical protein niasHT_036713 [Heterodera trifolii]|uniref:Retrotransposon gag domain-containing protein n=1 Tax=Heterodera trifolii TaxID=157864 RepID=A0ABD2IQC2_9BILA
MESTGTARSAAGLPLPATYDGTTDFHNYLKGFNLIATAHSWQPARCAQIFPLYLRGAVKAIYEGLDQNIKNNWRELVDTLAEKLKHISSGLAARQKLAHRKQFPGETLEEFAQEIINLVNRAYPNNNIQMDFQALQLGDKENAVKEENEKRLQQFRLGIAKDFFRANMLPSIKEKILFMGEPTTMEEAVAQAKRVEQVQESLAEDYWKQAQNTKAEVALAEVNAVRTELNELRDRQKAQQSQQRTEINQNTEERNFPNNWQGNRPPGNPFMTRGGYNPRGFRGRFQRFQGFRGGGNSRNANSTPLGNRFHPSNNYNSQQFQNQNQNWNTNRGRGGNGQIRGRMNDNSGGNRTGWRVNEISFPYICILTIICSLMIVPTAGQYQICPTKPTAEISVTIGFPEEQNCSLPTGRQPIKTKAILYIPIRIPRSFPVFKCWNITTVTCTESFLRVVTLDHPPKKCESEASLKDCQESLNLRPMNRISETRWESLMPIRKEYGWYGVNCFNNIQTIIEEGTGGILDGEKLVTSWGDSLKIEQLITGKEEWVRLPGAVELLMWRIPSGEFWDTHFSIGPVMTETWPGQAIAVHELQYTFAVSRDQERKNKVFGVPREALKMDNNVFIYEIANTPKYYYYSVSTSNYYYYSASTSNHYYYSANTPKYYYYSVSTSNYYYYSASTSNHYYYSANTPKYYYYSVSTSNYYYYSANTPKYYYYSANTPKYYYYSANTPKYYYYSVSTTNYYYYSASTSNHYYYSANTPKYYYYSANTPKYYYYSVSTSNYYYYSASTSNHYYYSANTPKYYYYSVSTSNYYYYSANTPKYYYYSANTPKYYYYSANTPKYYYYSVSTTNYYYYSASTSNHYYYSANTPKYYYYSVSTSNYYYYSAKTPNKFHSTQRNHKHYH